MAALEAQAAEGVEVAAAPGFGALFHARELGVPVFGSLGPVLGQAVAVLAEHFDGDLAQVGIAELAVLHAGEGLEGVGGAAALVDTHVELAAGEGALHTAEEDGDGIGLHRWMGGDELIVVVEGVEVEQMVLAREQLAALVELAGAYAHIAVLYSHSHLDHLQVGEPDAVHATEGAEVDERHGCR